MKDVNYGCLAVMWIIGAIVCFALFEPIINSSPPYSSLGYVAICFGGFSGIIYLSNRAEKKIREAEERKKLGISGGVEDES